MTADKIVVSNEEIAQIKEEIAKDPLLREKLPSPVPLWGKVAFSVVALVFPLLCVFTIVLRIAFRGQPPRVKYAWLSFLLLS